jgi:UDP-GlcNAc:undecaprenyl-phosphate GlcNAc-1-phosphate transferase
MGDSGSTLLGLALAWLCINASQDPAPVARPVTMLWIVAIPLYDLCWTVIRRSIQGIPPFRSDQGHLHHMVLQAGIGVQGAFVLMFVIAVFLASIGVTLDRAGVSDSWSLALFVAAGVLTVWLLCSPSVLRTLIPRAFRNARPAVSN